MVYQNRWLSVREDQIERPDGSHGIYSVIDRPDYAVVIASENGGFHLVDQYRYPVDGRYWEFPQGSLPGREPHDLLETARTELSEETGLRARSPRPAGMLFSWHGASGQQCAVFLAPTSSTVHRTVRWRNKTCGTNGSREASSSE